MVHGVFQVALAQPPLEFVVQGFPVLQAGGVVLVLRSADEVRHSHGLGQTLKGVLGGCGEAQPTVVGGLVQTSRRGVREVVANSLPVDSQHIEHGNVGDTEPEKGLKKADIHHLALGVRVAGSIPVIKRHHAGHGPKHPGDLVGQRYRRQVGRGIRKTGHADVAAHALGDGAEARPVFVGARLSEPRVTQHHQLGVRFLEVVGSQPPTLHCAGPKTFDQDVCLGR